jgi:hypothetical protein
VPSKVTWQRGSDRVALIQQTKYPLEASTTIEVAAEKPADFEMMLRIPAWAGAKTAIAVNGKRVALGPEAGRFASLRRTWKNGDRVEIEFDMPTVFEAVDPQHPDLLAPVHGPLALFSVGEMPASLTKQQLLSATQVAGGSTDWRANSDAGALTLRPFAAIQDEHYRLYLKIES